MSHDPGRVLIIDDERGPRESLRMLFKKAFSVLTAASVDEGMALLREQAPEVIIMDIRMPVKSGIEGLAEIRAIDPQVSVIMLTGYGTLETAQEAIRLGANDYIRKPFDAAEMLKVVDANAQQTRVRRRRAETERELRALSENLRAQLSDRDRMARLGLASSELVHDLKNPLTAVLGYVDLLACELRERPAGADTAPAETLEYLEAIEVNVNRCRELVDTWQMLGRRNPAGGERLAPADLVDDAVCALHPAEGVRLAVDASGEARRACLCGDRLQLSRALQNIIHNALQAAGEEAGRVTVSACVVDGADAVFVVEDNGPGIPPDLRDRIFEPFFTTKCAGRGTGLGLFIARKVVEDHGGQILIDNAPAGGTKVTVTVPAA